MSTETSTLVSNHTPTESDQTDEGPKGPQVHWLKFSMIVYFIGCGGPWGFEDAVASGYPLFTLFFIILVPLVWSIPISLVTAELSTMLPSNEGAMGWIKEGLGDKVAFIAAHLYWINWIIDTALYPVLITDYIKTISEKHLDNWEITYFFPLVIILIVLGLNLVGVDLLANLSMVLSVLQMIPFFIILGMVAYKGMIIPQEWIRVPAGQFDLKYVENLGLCFQVCVWSFSGYDAVGSMIEELKDADTGIYKSFAMSIFLSILTYLICLIGAFSIDQNYYAWGAGTFTNLGGSWLYYMTIVAAIFGLFGTYNAVFFPTSQQLCTLGEPVFLDIPLLTYRHPTFNTPWVALFINAFITAIFSLLNFDVLVQINNVLYSFTLLLVFLSAIILRYSENGKDLPRPFKATESNALLYILLFWPVVICFILVILATVTNYWIGVSGLGLIIVFYIILHMCEYRKKHYPRATPNNNTVQED